MITCGAQELKLHTSWSYHLGKGGRDVEGQVDVPVLWLEHRCHSLSVPFVLPWDTRSADSESMGSDAKFLAEAEEQEPSRQTIGEEGGDQSLQLRGLDLERWGEFWELLHDSSLHSVVDGALISFNFSVMDIVHDEQWQQREHLRANLSLLGP